MKRTPIARKTPIQAKTPMRKTRRKSTPARQSARGMDCTLRLPGCRNDPATVVLCHLRQFGGGGTGIKPRDTEAVYGRDHCHAIIDGRARLNPDMPLARKWETLARALVRTHRQMLEQGILVLKGEAA